MRLFARGKPQSAKAKLRAGTKAVARGDYQAAVALLSEALQESDSLAAQLNLGTAYYHLQQYTQAIEQFTRVIQVQPDNAKAWLNLAAAHTALGHLAEAEQALAEVLRINPEHPDAHYNMALVKLRRRQPFDAMAQLELELAAHSGHRQARRLLAEIKNKYI